MSKRGRKLIGKVADTNQSQIELSKNQQLVRDSNGLLVLFGNRVVTKYRSDYINAIKSRHGNQLYLKHLEDQTINESLKYTQEYIEKNEKRNRAVSKYREKEREQTTTKAQKYQALEAKNIELDAEAAKLENEFTQAIQHLLQMGLQINQLPVEIMQTLIEYNLIQN